MSYANVNVNYASLGRRFLALVLDGIILAIPALMLSMLIPFFGGLLAYFLYAPIFESSDLRATPGKYLVGIEVVDLNGQRLPFRAALLRNIIKAISTALLFLGFILALFSERKQTVHDLIAESLVIYGRTEIPVLGAWIDQVKNIFGNKEDESQIQNPLTLASTAPEPARGSNALNELERLQALREKGALTEEEFQDQKRKIIF